MNSQTIVLNAQTWKATKPDNGGDGDNDDDDDICYTVNGREVVMSLTGHLIGINDAYAEGVINKTMSTVACTPVGGKIAGSHGIEYERIT